jgi:hypothetical protein
MKQQQQHLIPWTIILEEAIQTFIDQYGLAPLRMKCESRIAILMYQYDDEIFQRQYEQRQPTDYQVKDRIMNFIKTFLFSSICYV